MADTQPSSVKVSLANGGRGARTFFDADRQAHTLAPGATWEGKIFSADKDSLSDLVDADASGATGGGATIDRAVTDLQPLDGLDRDQLLAVATQEGLLTLGDDATEDEIREAIEKAREESGADQLADDIKSLKSDNTRDELIKLASKESVAIETDDNKDQLALKIAQARQANA